MKTALENKKGRWLRTIAPLSHDVRDAACHCTMMVCVSAPHGVTYGLLN